MQKVVLATVVLAAAFAFGMSGLPGPMFAAVMDWAVEQGFLVMNGPVGEVVRSSL